MSYRPGEIHRCAGCGRSQWLVGRSTAECAFCGTAEPLAEQPAAQPRPMLKLGKGGGIVRRMVPA